MKLMMSLTLIALGVLAGITINESNANSKIKAQSIAPCDDTKLGEIAEFVKSDATSRAQLRRAAAGDADSALALAVMFGKIDFGRMMCFERMAAENGNKVSQANYGKHLLESKDPLVRARGKYWVDKSNTP